MFDSASLSFEQTAPFFLVQLCSLLPINHPPKLSSPLASYVACLNPEQSQTTVFSVLLEDQDPPSISSAIFRLTAAVKTGSVTLNDTAIASLVFHAGDGRSDNYMVAEGQKNVVAAALVGMAYQGIALGTDSVLISVNDQSWPPYESQLQAWIRALVVMELCVICAACSLC